jgi:hypothetical protein
MLDDHREALGKRERGIREEMRVKGKDVDDDATVADDF